MTRGLVGGLIAGVLAVGALSASVAWTQTTGAFDSLSPGNQKIAKALFEAQAPAPGSTATPLTLDEIAQKKQGGGGWGQVFKDMKAQGLVQDKNLGQAVSKFERAQHGTATGGQYGRGESGKTSHSTNAGRGHAFGSSGDRSGGAGHGGRGGGKR